MDLWLRPTLDWFLSELDPLPNGKVRGRFYVQGICEFIPSHFEIKNHFRKFYSNQDDLKFDRSFERFFEQEDIRIKTSLFQERIIEQNEAVMQTAYDYVSQKRQWNTLRLLRTEFYAQHRRFLLLTSQSKSSLKKFRKYCKGPADLLNTGILTSKDIMLGSTPVSLKEVYSLILLSYAMAAVRGPGRSVSLSPKKSDFSIWRQSISKDAEKETFDELVSVLWPEVNSQPNDPVVPSEGKRASDIDNHALEDLPGFNDLDQCPMLSPEIVQDFIHDRASSFFYHSPGDDFDFSIFLNMEKFDEPSADVKLHVKKIPVADEKACVSEPASVRELVRNIFFLQVLGFLICEQ